jgi:hypothetical protein
MSMPLSDKQLDQLLSICSFDKRHSSYVYIPIIQQLYGAAKAQAYKDHYKIELAAERP